jgi:class 3 adenylate cyclase
VAEPSHVEPTPPQVRDAERRQITVLFCDLAGSTQLSSRLDPEDWREVVRGYQQCAGEVIGRFDGHVAQYLGDGILAYFGFPRAHEDDAERALRAGLRIASRLRVRVGVHTGPVVVGEMGESARTETLAMGETTNLAARPQDQAEPDTVVMSAATLRLVQGIFVTRDLGERALKGIAKPVRLIQALRATGVRSRLDLAAAAGLTPLVGRDQELGLLDDRWAQVKEGWGQAVLISGEAGIGKSRLVQAFRERIAEQPHTWLECRCSPYTQDSAFYPVQELHRQGLSWRAEDPVEEKLAHLEAGLEMAGFDLNEAVPLMAAFHWMRLPEHSPALTLSPEVQRRKTLELLAEWLLRLGLQQSSILLMEDLHWLDPSTLELLGQVLERVPRANVLLGHLDEALRQGQRAIEQARRTGHANSLCLALHWGGVWVRFCRGELSELHSIGGEMLELAESYGLPLWAGVARLVRGGALALNAGDPAGVEAAREGLAMAGATGLQGAAPMLLRAIAEAELRVGRADAALEAVAGGLSLAEATGQHFDDAYLHGVRGEALRERDPEGAEAALRQGLEIARQQSAKTPELHVATQLAHLWRDQGRSAEARSLLAPVYEWFTEGLDTPLLQNTKALLEELA